LFLTKVLETVTFVQVEHWLSTLYGSDSTPTYEHNPTTVRIMYEVMRSSQRAEALADARIEASSILVKDLRIESELPLLLPRKAVSIFQCEHPGVQ
jgi:hypothetical protein